MDHKTLEIKATTTTDRGEFIALAAAYSTDRANERIIPGAFAQTIKRWQESGKQMPLHWNHSGDPKDIIGTVDPASLRETKDGLEVAGKLDLTESEVAREAWRLMKNGAASLSFGYMVTDEAEAEDGVLELKTIDLFEITITPSPMNADTRVLAMKSAQPFIADAEQLVEYMRVNEDKVGIPWTGEQRGEFKATLAKKVDEWVDKHVVEEEPEESSAAEEEVAVKKEVENAKPRDPLKDKLVAGHLDDLSH